MPIRKVKRPAIRRHKKSDPLLEGLNSLYRTTHDTSLPFLHTFFRCVEEQGSSVARDLREALVNRDYQKVVGYSIDPSSYSCPISFGWDYCVAEIGSKFPAFDLKVDREAVALKKFEESEARCSLTNERFRWTRDGAKSPFHSLLWGARRKISSLLGPFRWDEAETSFGWGPGATTRLPRERADAAHKYSGIPETTSNNAVLARCAIARVPRWLEEVCREANGTDRLGCHPLTPMSGELDSIVKIVPGNRVTTVPKNAKTDRVIAIEPDMNIYVQKGIGAMLRQRLKRVGVDLNDQSLNQRLALEASRDGQLCTVDISGASDSVSTELVRALLPEDWYAAMDRCRSHRGVLPSGTVVAYQKFSSMGNGFTFELESLIFWALVVSLLDHHPQERERQLGVYGDDLIFASSLYPLAVLLLRFCGFEVNPKKSFSDGPFRESCGKHYFRGVDVTPFYLRDKVDSYPRYIWLCNSVRRHARRMSPIYGCASVSKPAYDFIRRQLSGIWGQNLIPDGFGDGGLIGNPDEAHPTFSRRYQTYCYSAFTEGNRVVPLSTPGVLLKALSGGRDWHLADELSKLRDGGGVRRAGEQKSRLPKYGLVRNQPVPQWPDLGPWI